MPSEQPTMWDHHELLHHLEHAKGRAERCLTDDNDWSDEYQAAILELSTLISRLDRMRVSGFNAQDLLEEPRLIYTHANRISHEMVDLLKAAEEVDRLESVLCILRRAIPN